MSHYIKTDSNASECWRIRSDGPNYVHTDYRYEGERRMFQVAVRSPSAYRSLLFAGILWYTEFAFEASMWAHFYARARTCSRHETRSRRIEKCRFRNTAPLVDGWNPWLRSERPPRAKRQRRAVRCHARHYHCDNIIIHFEQQDYETQNYSCQSSWCASNFNSMFVAWRADSTLTTSVSTTQFAGFERTGPYVSARTYSSRCRPRLPDLRPTPFTR